LNIIKNYRDSNLSIGGNIIKLVKVNIVKYSNIQI